jgi:hypothetical protein
MQILLPSYDVSRGWSTPSIRLCLGLFMIVFWLSLLGCKPSLQSQRATKNLPWMKPVLAPTAEKGFFVHAIVRRIDYETGLVDIETEIGSFYAIADQDGLASLHKGDEITVYIVDDNAPVVQT